MLSFESLGEILSVTIQMKATEQYFPLVLRNILYKAVQLLSVLGFREWTVFQIVRTALVSEIVDYHLCLQTPSQRPMELE